MPILPVMSQSWGQLLKLKKVYCFFSVSMIKITTRLHKVGTVWTPYFTMSWFRLRQAEEWYNMLGHIYYTTSFHSFCKDFYHICLLYIFWVIISQHIITQLTTLSPPQGKSWHGEVRCSHSAHLTQPCCDFSYSTCFKEFLGGHSTSKTFQVKKVPSWF